MAVEPADDLFMLASGIVIADQMDMFFLWDGLVDQPEKLQPFLVPVALFGRERRPHR